MSAKRTSTAILMALLMGGAIGVGVTLVALSSSGEKPARPDSSTPQNIGMIGESGMDKLNRFECLKGETKQIILRGVEDGFSSANDETITKTDLHAFMQDRFGRKGAVGIDRSYDDSRLDQVLLDEIEIPSRTAQGLVVVRLQERMKLRNDTITIGDLINKSLDGHAHVETFARITNGLPSAWREEGELIFANLKDLTFAISVTDDGTSYPRTHANLLELIQSAETSLSVEFAISEDTMVDFVGVAACLRPEERKGTTFLASQSPLDASLLRLKCEKEDGTSHCNPYNGDTSCKAELPVACIKSGQHHKLPDNVSDPITKSSWTGSEIKFTPAVRGSSLETQNSAHALCRSTFGPDWRTVNIHDGRMIDNILAKGDASEHGKAWVDSPMEPYGNCWALNASIDVRTVP